MRRFASRHPFVLALLMVLLGAGAVAATTTTYSYRDANNTLRSVVAMVCGSSMCSAFVPLDTSGNPVDLATAAGQLPASSSVTKTAATVGTSSAQALASGTRRYLKICNESASAFAAYNFGGTAILNSAGGKTLTPYQCDEYAESFVPSDAVNMIASAVSTPVTILSK